MEITECPQHVDADVEEGVANAKDVLNALTADYLPALVGDYPGMFGMNGFAMAKSHLSQQACTVVHRMPPAGIVALHFPADNPVTGGSQKDHSQSPMVNLLPGGRGNAQWTAWLDVVAQFCHGIKDRAVLFRPFHENRESVIAISAPPASLRTCVRAKRVSPL